MAVIDKPVKAPKHLSADSRRLWRSICDEYPLESHGIATLTAALEARDRMITARDLVNDEGLVVVSRLGERKPHPAVAIERDARTLFFRGLRELGLEPDQDVRLPRVVRVSP